MKKTALVLILILGLISLAILNYNVVGVQAQQMPEPYQTYYDRYEPTMTPPSISVTSPQNNSITNTNSISLVLNVSGPQVVEHSPEISQHISHLVKVYYKGDWQTEGQILYFNEYERFDFLEFNTTLSNIPEGTHELQIIAIGAVGINVAMFGFEYHPDANASIIFTINSMQPTPSPEPTPTLTPYPSNGNHSLPDNSGTVVAVSVAIMVVVGVGLLVALKKLQRDNKR